MALVHVLDESLLGVHVLQAVLAEEELERRGVLVGEGGVVPCVQLVFSQLDHLDVLHFCLLLVLLLQGPLRGGQVLHGGGGVVDLVVPPLQIPRHLTLQLARARVVPRRKDARGPQRVTLLELCRRGDRRESTMLYPLVKPLVVLQVVHVVQVRSAVVRARGICPADPSAVDDFRRVVLPVEGGLAADLGARLVHPLRLRGLGGLLFNLGQALWPLHRSRRGHHGLACLLLLLRVRRHHCVRATDKPFSRFGSPVLFRSIFFFFRFFFGVGKVTSLKKQKSKIVDHLPAKQTKREE